MQFKKKSFLNLLFSSNLAQVPVKSSNSSPQLIVVINVYCVKYSNLMIPI